MSALSLVLYALVAVLALATIYSFFFSDKSSPKPSASNNAKVVQSATPDQFPSSAAERAAVIKARKEAMYQRARQKFLEKQSEAAK
jgi:hypothetical protein